MKIQRYIAKDMRSALAQDQFELHFQPLFATSREPVGLEALVRRGGMTAPAGIATSLMGAALSTS